MEKGQEDKRRILARGFYDFLKDPSIGGSYSASTRLPDLVLYRAGEYNFEIIFQEGGLSAMVKVNSPKINMEELVGVPYQIISSKKSKIENRLLPDWLSFFNGISARVKSERVKKN